MFIALEGVDGTGKTGLVTTLSKFLVPDVITPHAGPPPALDQLTVLSEYVDGLFATYYPGGSQHIVADRHHFGEAVYGPRYRPQANRDGYGALGAAGFRYAELYGASHGLVTVVLYTDDMDLLRSRIGERMSPTDIWTMDNDDLSTLMRSYVDLVRGSVTGVSMDVPLTPAGGKDLAARILSHGSERERAAMPIARHAQAGYLGRPDARAVIFCRNDRELKLEVLDQLDEARWRDVGLCPVTMEQAHVDELVGHVEPTALIWVVDRNGDPPQWLERIDAKQYIATDIAHLTEAYDAVEADQ